MNNANLKYKNKILIKSLYSNIEKYVGTEITIGGWIRDLKINKSKSITFIEVFDGSTVKAIQVVVICDKLNKLESDEDLEKISSKKILIEDSLPSIKDIGAGIILKGKLEYKPHNIKSLQLKSENKELLEAFNLANTLEIQVDNIENLKIFNKDGMNCNIKTHKDTELNDLKYFINYPHLKPRSKYYSSVARIRSKLCTTINEIMNTEGIIYINTPIITKFNYPKTFVDDYDQFLVTTLFSKNKINLTVDFFNCVNDFIDYYGNEYNSSKYIENFYKSNELFSSQCFLNSSTITHLIPYSLSYGSVYSLGPVFRSKMTNEDISKKDTSIIRHLSEFWMLEGVFGKIYMYKFIMYCSIYVLI